MADESPQITETPVESAPTEPQQAPETIKQGIQPQTPQEQPAEDWKAIAEKYKQNEPVYSTYEQFEQVLQANPDLAQTLESAVKEFVQKRSQPTRQVQAQGNEQLSQGHVFDPVTRSNVDPVTALRNEMRFKDYASEFTREFQGANLPNKEKVVQLAFNGCAQELLKINPDPFGNYTPQHVKTAFKNWLDSTTELNREMNTAYAAAKAKDQGPPSGSGGAPVRSANEIMNAQERKAYIAENLRAAHNVQ